MRRERHFGIACGASPVSPAPLHLKRSDALSKPRVPWIGRGAAHSRFIEGPPASLARWYSPSIRITPSHAPQFGGALPPLQDWRVPGPHDYRTGSPLFLRTLEQGRENTPTQQYRLEKARWTQFTLS